MPLYWHSRELQPTPGACALLAPQVVLAFMRRPDVAQRNVEIAAKKDKNGGWKIGDMLVKKKKATAAANKKLNSTTCFGVVVEVVCVKDNKSDDPYAWPWVLWEGDSSAMCPNDEQHYLDYKASYENNKFTSAAAGKFKITAKQLDAEWKAQQGEDTSSDILSALYDCRVSYCNCQRHHLPCC